MVAPATTADAAVKPKKYKSCAVMWKDYPHGVARAKNVKDKVRGRTKPVTTFTVNATTYRLNYRALDKDRDGITCERR